MFACRSFTFRGATCRRSGAGIATTTCRSLNASTRQEPSGTPTRRTGTCTSPAISTRTTFSPPPSSSFPGRDPAKQGAGKRRRKSGRRVGASATRRSSTTKLRRRAWTRTSTRSHLTSSGNNSRKGGEEEGGASLQAACSPRAFIDL